MFTIQLASSTVSFDFPFKPFVFLPSFPAAARAWEREGVCERKESCPPFCHSTFPPFIRLVAKKGPWNGYEDVIILAFTGHRFYLFLGESVRRPYSSCSSCPPNSLRRPCLDAPFHASSFLSWPTCSTPSAAPTPQCSPESAHSLSLSLSMTLVFFSPSSPLAILSRPHITGPARWD